MKASGVEVNLTDLATKMATHPLLAGLKKEHLQTLAQHAMETHYDPGEWLVHQGDIANRFYLIVSGRVALSLKQSGSDPVPIQELGPEDILGWSWVFEPFLWQFGAQAIEPTDAIFFYGTWLRDRCEENHDLGYEIIKRMAGAAMQRLQATRELLLNRATTHK